MLVQMSGISKTFGGAAALSDVSFDLREGEVHVLAGENGAGKSTLIRILSGAETDFSGSLRVDGVPVAFRGPLDAIRSGIATIHQELSLVGAMSVADNLFLGRERTGRLGAVARQAQHREAARLLAEVGLDVDPSAVVEELPIAVQQLVEIARALASGARVLVMDEPTSALDDTETRLLFDRITRLKAQKKAIVYITHRMEEIYALADRITVLRDGARVGTAPASELARDTLVTWMAGPRPTADRASPSRSPGAYALEVGNLRVAGPTGARVVDGVSLGVRRGEIVGLAGLRGSGASEILHALFGSSGGVASGEVVLCRRPYVARSPRRSIQRGLVLLPSDRKASGLCPDGAVIENATLASLERFSRAGFMRGDEERGAVREIGERFRLRVAALDLPVSALSGGNQQKVLVARCALARPSVLLLDEPTRGVDVGAKADIHEAMRSWAGEGVGIIVATSDTEELIELCDKILVLVRGRIVARLAGAAATREAILGLAMGHDDARAVP